MTEPNLFGTGFLYGSETDPTALYVTANAVHQCACRELCLQGRRALEEKVDAHVEGLYETLAGTAGDAYAVRLGFTCLRGPGEKSCEPVLGETVVVPLPRIILESWR